MANSNMYTFNADAVLKKYASYLCADSNTTLLVVSWKPLNETSKNALNKSVAALKLGKIGWASVGISYEGEIVPPFSVRDMWFLAEGLDPGNIVICDAQSTKLFLDAYNAKAAHNAVSRIMCRNVAFFDDFATLITKDKRCAWQVLKSLI